MTNLNERICIFCKKVYSLSYTDKHGYSHNLNTSYCSKSCSTSAQRSVTVEDLKNKAIGFVKQAEKYSTKEEICKGVGHSSKTFLKHKLSFTEINHEAGFSKPKSAFQERVRMFLESRFENIEHEKTFSGLTGKTGHLLRVDFYIPEINTVVEADGSQHLYPNHPWGTHKNGTVAEYDNLKNDFFEKEGICLVRIPYKRNLRESDISSRLA